MKATIIFIAVVLAVPAQADWGVDPWLSSAWLEYPGSETVSLFVRPDGGGRQFTQAMTVSGNTVDATVHLEIYNYSGVPMVDYPAEDMWLEVADGGLVPCALGACADAATDQDGQTSWVAPLRAGGSSESDCFVVINGDILYGSNLNLHFNSPDLNGDLVVNLADVGLFAEDFFSYYHYRSDFYCDQVLNIADLSMMAQALSATCP
jgi:hypothetical protein